MHISVSPLKKDIISHMAGGNMPIKNIQHISDLITINLEV